MTSARHLSVLVTLAACSGSPARTPPQQTALGSASAQASSAALVSTAAPSAVPAPPAAPAELAMYPVANIYSLIDLWATDDGIELRVGSDPGGGMMGRFRFVPLVDGRPDFARETEMVHYANTASLIKQTTGGGFIEIAGRRPSLVLHVVSGFRSAPSDRYSQLDAHQQWGSYLGAGGADGIGIGIGIWNNDNLLEFRSPDPMQVMTELVPVLPRLRVLGKPRVEAPSLPAALEKRLTAEGYALETFRVLNSGEVVAIGRLNLAEGFGSVVWKDDLRKPTYTVVGDALDAEAELTMLGGDSLAALRLRAGDRVMKLGDAGWIEESTVAAGALPDVWFGTTMLLKLGADMFARTSASSPWQRVQRHSTDIALEESFAVTPSGVIYKTEDEQLLSSRKPSRPLLEVTEDDLVEGRKASVLRGGSDDATGEPAGGVVMQTKCSGYYVLLHRGPEDEPADEQHARIASALKGAQKELVGVKFIVSRERGLELFGALVPSYDVAGKVKARLAKVKGVDGDTICGEPPALREVKIDLGTGKIDN